MTNRRRKNVTWVDDRSATRSAKRPHPFVAEAPIREEVREAWTSNLVPGSLWIACCDLAENGAFDHPFYARHEVPYVTAAFSPRSAVVTNGSLAVYLGTTRVEEASPGRSNIVRSVLRHTFLIGHRRWLVSDLNLLRPASLEVLG